MKVFLKLLHVLSPISLNHLLPSVVDVCVFHIILWNIVVFHIVLPNTVLPNTKIF